ncbi:glycosyltransferase family 2 protein [Parabacteroides sp. ZJ-118]|uniref:glycosyltransferase family 2 protein n=1 Tax=Parabacteroides sp. ZJ-118 TaxID=2709398 RepID=UPI0013EAFC0F|nr:glycosyltransferase family 2 protein [Parabacteroides sp. ZJ-118]
MSHNNLIENPLVSIVVPVYNMGDSLTQCVCCLLDQSYKNIELVLVDDGSTDDSLTVCRTLARKDGRISVIHTENRGSGSARNEGIKASSGRYIYFPDADDVLSSDAIAIMVDAITSDLTCDLVVFGFRSIKASGEEISVKVYEERIATGDELRKSYSECMGTRTKWGIQGAPWNKFFDLEVIKKYSIIFPNLRRHQDEGFIGRYMCYVYKVKFIPDVLYTYKVNDIKKTWSKYPLDYINAVIGLNEVRKTTIYQWNSDDFQTQQMLQKEFICNTIKALELVFSPKMEGGLSERKRFIKKGINTSKILEVPIPPILGLYQRAALKLMNNSMSLTLLLFYIKTRFEKWGIL